MDSTIRRTLWGAFAALALLALIGLVLTLTVMQVGKRQEYRIVHGSEPLIDAVNTMDEDIITMLAAARGYQLTGNTQFQQQYDDAGIPLYFEFRSSNSLPPAWGFAAGGLLRKSISRFNASFLVTNRFSSSCSRNFSASAALRCSIRRSRSGPLALLTSPESRPTSPPFCPSSRCLSAIIFWAAADSNRA